jgi:hypothetical protein
MENRALLNQGRAIGPDQILKVTALLYLKEALIAQEYESCPELIDSAKGLGAAQSDINAVIADYLDADYPYKQKGGRVRP